MSIFKKRRGNDNLIKIYRKYIKKIQNLRIVIQEGIKYKRLVLISINIYHPTFLTNNQK